MLLTADSRYELFVNGQWLGVGPVRSFPWSYSYDEYDLTSYLLPDQENVIALRVVHWGDHSMQYIRGRGGMLAELVLSDANGQQEHIVSDTSWSVSPDNALLSHTPRISIQLGYEEQYDARNSEPGWTTTGFDTSNWQAAQVIGPVGILPWSQLEPRSIPFLTLDEVMPERILAAELAQPQPGFRWSFDMRHRLDAARIGLRAEPIGQRGQAFATEIIAPHACSVTITASASYDSRRIVCGGRSLSRLPATLKLPAGRTLFIIIGETWPSLLFATTADLHFDATRLMPDAHVDAVWCYLGPFDERTEMEAIYAASSPQDLPTVPRHAIASSENMEDIALLTTTQRFLLPEHGWCDASIDGPQPRQRIAGQRVPLIENAPQMLHRHAAYATVHPQPDGDVHVVLDFGREIVGYLELELDAPEGTILDSNLFEGIDEGGIFWVERLHNSFRYICRQGRQTFRSHVRRGLRYLSLTIRGGPVQLHNIRCLLNTYPVERRGRFLCSDPLLTRIWEVAAYTVQLCMEDTYVDCPAYEQTFWVGDARNSALVNAVAFGASELTARCLRLAGQSLSMHLDSLKPPHWRTVPHLVTDHAMSGWFSQIPMWSFLWIWNVWEHYLLTGDTATLAALYADVRECLDRCLNFLTERDLLDIPDVWNLVDWSAMDLTRDGEVTANSALLVESLRHASVMAETLSTLPATSLDRTSLQEDASRYRQAMERIYTAINTYCWSEERGAYVDTLRDDVAYQRYASRMQQRGLPAESRELFLSRTRISEQTNTLVLQCHCAPAERATRILPLVEIASEGNFVGSDPSRSLAWPAEQTIPVGSPWFLFFTLETLIAQGKVESAIAIIRDQWGMMIEKGATSFWEMFPGYLPGHWSRSLCHGWSAAPAYFLSTQILGVQPSAPGYSRVSIQPHLGSLQFAEGTVPTPHGDIFVRWSRDQRGLTVLVDLPTPLIGDLRCDKSLGVPIAQRGTPGKIEEEGENWKIVLPSGRHTITFQDL